METDIKDNTMFVEFYGLPGSGKSTISHLVAEELRRQGKTVQEPTYDTDHKYSPSVRKGIKLQKLTRYAMFNPWKCKELFKLIRDNGYTGSEIISQAANIAPKLWEYDCARADYVFFDEGVTASAISLVNNNGSSFENEKALYNLCKQRTVRKFYIKVPPEIALLRMAGRAKHDSRIEKIRDEAERNSALKAIETNCEKIIGIRIEGTKSIKEIIRDILAEMENEQ